MAYALENGGMPYVERDTSLSYGQRLLRAKRAAARCQVPTKSGGDCEAALISGAQWCGPHKKTVGKAVASLVVSP